MAFAAAWARVCASIALTICLVTTAGAADKPNIVLILTDDEDVAIHQFMPKTKRLLHDEGTTFTNFIISYPWCCPSRTSILRGQYAHNTQVVGNEPPYGGYETLHARGLQSSTLATWLSEAGYRTAMVGKYINGYRPEQDGVPAGWTDWYVGGNAHLSYDYTLNENGRLVHYGSEPADYLNDVLTDKSVHVIESVAAADEPFFLYVLPYNPHSPSVAAPRHLGMFDDAELPRPPSFGKVTAGQPDFLRLMPALEGKVLAHMEREYRLRLASLQGIDDMVERIVEALAATGQLDNTYIVYSSDNGFHIGEHGLVAGKTFPYEEDIKVPFVVRGPGVPKRATVDELALNIDLAPTFAALAGVAVPDFVDGRSLLPLLRDEAAPWRQAVLLERRAFEWQYEHFAGKHGLTGEALMQAAHFNGLRTADWTYVEHATGERELYDLAADPHQLANLAATADADLLAALSARLNELAACAGATCRTLEDLPVPPAPKPIAAATPATPTSKE
jgi:arylsulfatase A-like enzyme